MFKLVVLSVVVALAAAKPSILAPWGVGGVGLAAPWGVGGVGVAAPWIGAPLAAAPLAAAVVGVGASNYRGPLSLAPGQPANILAADGRPLDTLDVNVDRAVHLTAKALDHGLGAHLLKKRSLVAPWGAPLALSAGVIAPAPVIAAHVAAPVVAAPAVAGLGWGHAARLGHLW